MTAEKLKHRYLIAYTYIYIHIYNAMAELISESLEGSTLYRETKEQPKGDSHIPEKNLKSIGVIYAATCLEKPRGDPAATGAWHRNRADESACSGENRECHTPRRHAA